MGRHVRPDERELLRGLMLTGLTEHAGLWLPTRDAWKVMYGMSPDAGQHELYGFALGLPEGVRYIAPHYTQRIVLDPLHDAGLVERKQRARNACWFWRVPEVPPVPDTFPVDWARPPVLA